MTDLPVLSQVVRVTLLTVPLKALSMSMLNSSLPKVVSSSVDTPQREHNGTCGCGWASSISESIETSAAGAGSRSASQPIPATRANVRVRMVLRIFIASCCEHSMLGLLLKIRVSRTE